MLTQFFLWLRSTGLSEEAQGLAEYALILVLVALAVLIALTALGTTIADVFDTIVNAL